MRLLLSPVELRPPHLVLLVCSALVEYESISGKTLQESIEGEMSGELEELLVAIGTTNALGGFCSRFFPLNLRLTSALKGFYSSLLQ